MCKDECSPHCVNQQSCDHEGGACEGGCTDGWVGERCTEGKMYCLLVCWKLKLTLNKWCHEIRYNTEISFYDSFFYSKNSLLYLLFFTMLKFMVQCNLDNVYLSNISGVKKPQTICLNEIVLCILYFTCRLYKITLLSFNEIVSGIFHKVHNLCETFSELGINYYLFMYSLLEWYIWWRM